MLNTKFTHNQTLTLKDGRVVVVTDIPELDRDLLVVLDSDQEIRVINTFQVAA